MVHEGATIVESILNDNYSIHAIILIVACCIFGFLQLFDWPADVKQQLAKCTYMQ